MSPQQGYFLSHITLTKLLHLQETTIYMHLRWAQRTPINASKDHSKTHQGGGICQRDTPKMAGDVGVFCVFQALQNICWSSRMLPLVFQMGYIGARRVVPQKKHYMLMQNYRSWISILRFLIMNSSLSFPSPKVLYPMKFNTLRSSVVSNTVVKKLHFTLNQLEPFPISGIAWKNTFTDVPVQLTLLRLEFSWHMLPLTLFICAWITFGGLYRDYQIFLQFRSFWVQKILYTQGVSGTI